MPRLPPSPDLEWSPEGVPIARRFADVYFSKAGGLAEAEAVFLAGCGLPQGWDGRGRYAILELGFGAGLNLLATWRAWRQRPQRGVLHYVAIEAFPMARADAARALAAFPELRPWTERLLAYWPVAAYAPQRIWLDDVALTIVVGEAAEALAQLEGCFDAFFLDGFAPAKNPDMWRAAIATQLAALAAPGARLATYSVAGDVRRALVAAGFEVAKRPGFGAKRERLEGRLIAPPRATHALYPGGGEAPKRVAIIGGGIAGAAAARALTQRGADVVLLEGGESLGAGASGNAGGLVMPRLDRGRGPVQELYLAAFLHAVKAYEACGAMTACGVLERDRADVRADPPLPRDWISDGEAEDVLHLRAGAVRPHLALEAWTCAADIRVEAQVASLEQTDAGWRLRDAQQCVLAEADGVVLANGALLNTFAQTYWLELRLTAGQMELAQLQGGLPRSALVEESYAVPLGDLLLFGASFERTEDNRAAVNAAVRAANIAALERLAPDLAQRLKRETTVSRAAVRAAAPDYAPIMGLAPDAPAWLARQAGLAHGRAPDLSAPAPRHRGLYLLGGLGARGLTLAPLLAEALADDMFGAPNVLSRASLGAIHPARFLHRKVKKSLTKLDARAGDDEVGHVSPGGVHPDEP